MDREWNDTQPIYRQLRDRVVALMLDGVLHEGDPLPSVRTVAAEYRLNPITVLKGYQELVDEELVETRRGRGMFIKPGARKSLLNAERELLMREVSFIADVAVLPRWMQVSQALDYLGGVHPRFDRAKAESFLAKTNIKRTSKVRELSKGMVTQLHLALVMAIDAKLLVLDEPT